MSATAKNDLTTLVPQKLVDDWAKYTIIEFQNQLKKKKIGVTGELFRSFKKQLQMNGGDVGAVMVKFLMYGRFRDMGVGYGMKAYERKTNKANLIAAKRYGANVSYSSRQPKRWYNKTKTSQTFRLQELLVAEMGDNIRQWVSKEFAADVTIQL